MVDERRRHEILGLGKGRMVSCASLEGIHELKEAVASLLLRRVARGSYVIPFSNPGARADIYEEAVVLSERVAARSWIIEAAASCPGARLPQRFLRKS